MADPYAQGDNSAQEDILRNGTPYRLLAHSAHYNSNISSNIPEELQQAALNFFQNEIQQHSIGSTPTVASGFHRNIKTKLDF